MNSQFHTDMLHLNPDWRVEDQGESERKGGREERGKETDREREIERRHIWRDR